MSGQEIGWLLRPREHLSLLSTRRTTIIVTRVRLIAGLFAVFTPLWIIADISAFPSEVWHGLAAARLLATAAFVAILVSAKSMDSIHNAYRSLAMLLAVPMLFFLFSYQHMAQFELHGFQAAFSTGYAFLPFVVVAGLSIFPLTLIECICYAAPMLALQVVAAALRWPVLDWPTVAASIWLLMLITAVSALAGLSQLAFMIVLVREAIHDSMTGCFSRHSGEELLELQFILAKRSKASLSLAFIDLDHFKQVNDTFGHDAGDAVLINATASIRDHLRMGDMLIRWGGEEFLLIMPNTDFKQALAALNRVRKSGFGKRPDGTPVTASIGLAELSQQDTEHWRDLVELSDNRMYQAKESGRDRIVAGN
ncbi:GGDEF domain-containing protein [Novimethylophilus sp.]|uniref:GGDEF domain-containing protein n=1 Tax=Novimethylophilus sp. TaxID=2137426 RepID=UPI002F4105A2